MALPSAVTVASLTVVVVAGVGLAAATATDSDRPAGHSTSPPATHRTHHQPKVTATKPRHRGHAQPQHRQAGSTPRVPTVPVGVYNNSGITGLAAEKAAILEAAGWKVAATDNWYGDIAANTVYFPSGKRSDAKRLATVLHIDRLRPAVAPMQFDRLTVIFTSS